MQIKTPSGSTINVKSNPSKTIDMGKSDVSIHDVPSKQLKVAPNPSKIRMNEKQAMKAEDDADWERERLNNSDMPNTKIGMAIYKKKVAIGNAIEGIKEADLTHDIKLATDPTVRKAKSTARHVKSKTVKVAKAAHEYERKRYAEARAKEAARKAQEEEDLYEEVETKTPSGTVKKVKKLRTETTTKVTEDAKGNKTTETTTKAVQRPGKKLIDKINGAIANGTAIIDTPALMAEKRKLENAKRRAELKKAGIVVSKKPEPRKAKPGPGVRKGTLGRNPGGLPVKSHKSGPGKAAGGLPVKSHKSGPGVRRGGLPVKSHKSGPGTGNRAGPVNRQKSVNFAMKKRSRK